MKNAMVMFSVFLIVGCAGSPMHISSLSDDELQKVDDYTLCVAVTPRELYSPSYSVMREVGRRGINCRSIYSYTPTPKSQPQQQQIIIQQQVPTIFQNPAACIQDGGGTYCPYKN